MQPHDASGDILPLDRIAGMVADAGHAGRAIDLGAADVEMAHAVRPHLQREGLTPLIVAFPQSVESLRETLIMAQDFGAPYVNVVGQVFPLTVDGAIPVIRKWIEMSDEVGMPVHFETHRNCITNDLFATLQMLDAVPEITAERNPDDMLDFFARASLVSVPVLVSSGTRLRIAEGLACKRPIVSTTPGAAGLDPGDGTPWIVADGTDSYADALARVLTDTALSKQVASDGWAFAETLDWNSLRVPLSEAIEGVVEAAR